MNETGCSSRLCVVAMVAVAACARPELPRPVAADAARSGVSVAQLTVGRDTYLAKCARCHLAVEPRAYPASAWPHEVNEMRERSNLTDDEHHAILTYLQTFSAK